MLSRVGRRPHFSLVFWVLLDAALSPGKNTYPKIGALWIEVPGDQQQPLEAENKEEGVC